MRVLLIVTLLIVARCSFASAISVLPIIANISAKQHYTDIKVVNAGKSTAYVTISVARLLHPGTAQQRIEKLEGNPRSVGLVASPNKVIIPVGQTRRVRLLSLLRNPLKESDYIVTVKPVQGELESYRNPKTKVKMGIEVILAYAIHAFVRPVNAKPNLVFKQNAHHLTVRNTGNSNILLSFVIQCAPKSHSPKKCVKLPGRRMYPGNVWQLKLPYLTPVTYETLVNSITTRKPIH